MPEEPETAPETGTGNEEVAPEVVEDSPVTDTPADDSADGDNDETETGTQDHEAKAESHIPYSRFKSVNERMKAAEAKAAELEARLQALTPRVEPPPVLPKDKLKRSLKAAPADMSPLEQMEYYALETIEQHSEVLDNWFEKKFGMTADQAAATLAHTTTTTRETIVAQFEKACSERGLDPRNPAVQDSVGRMMDSKKFKSFGEAMDVFVKPKTNGTVQRKNVKGPETVGVEIGGLSSVRVLPKNAKEAGILASQGKSVEHVSVSDILKASVGS
jgi:hypothetical protein